MIRGLVAVVGRPNVGKSTLFNRLTRSDQAIVDDRPGVTRDRVYGTVWEDADRQNGFTLIDTGGFETDDFKFQPFSENLVWKQTQAAVDEADIVVLLLDGKAGLCPHDRELYDYLNKHQKTSLVVINKIDGAGETQLVWDFFELDHEPLHISAAHNRGVVDLREKLLEILADQKGLAKRGEGNGPSIAIVGRPNAGKSSILNRLTGEERAVVSEIAGTTRDAVDTHITFHGQPYTLVDTAGIRRKSKIYEKIESLSVIRSLRAIERADVVLLILDASEGLTDQDMRLADLTSERRKPILIVINKWDLVAEKSSNSGKEWTEAIHHQLKTIAYAPVVFVSCLENQRVHKLMASVVSLLDQAQKRVETAKVNQVLKQVVQEHTPALIKGKTKRVKFYFATQVTVAPPTFVVFCNVAQEIQDSYIRYMTNRFRELLGFPEVPIRLIFRAKTDTKVRSSQGRPRRERSEKGDIDLGDEVLSDEELFDSGAVFEGGLIPADGGEDPWGPNM
jgi:GTP-binding protein